MCFLLPENCNFFTTPSHHSHSTYHKCRQNTGIVSVHYVHSCAHSTWRLAAVCNSSPKPLNQTDEQTARQDKRRSCPLKMTGQMKKKIYVRLNFWKTRSFTATKFPGVAAWSKDKILFSMSVRIPLQVCWGRGIESPDLLYSSEKRKKSRSKPSRQSDQAGDRKQKKGFLLPQTTSFGSKSQSCC